MPAVRQQSKLPRTDKLHLSDGPVCDVILAIAHLSSNPYHTVPWKFNLNNHIHCFQITQQIIVKDIIQQIENN